MELDDAKNRNSREESNGERNHIEVQNSEDIPDGYKSKLDGLKTNVSSTIETLYEKESSACVGLTEDVVDTRETGKVNTEANVASEGNSEVSLASACNEMNVLEKVEMPQLFERNEESESKKQTLSNGNSRRQSEDDSDFIKSDENDRRETSDELSEGKSGIFTPLGKESNGENIDLTTDQEMTLANANGYPTGECTNPGGGVTPAKSIKRKISLSPGVEFEAYPDTKKPKLAADQIDATRNNYQALNADACNGETSDDSTVEVRANYSAESGPSQDIRDFEPSQDTFNFDPLQDTCDLEPSRVTRNFETPDMTVDEVSETSLVSEGEKEAVQLGDSEEVSVESHQPNMLPVEGKSVQLAQSEGIHFSRNEAEINISKMSESKSILENKSANSEVSSAIGDYASKPERDHLVENTLLCEEMSPGSAELKTSLPPDSNMVEKSETPLGSAELIINEVNPQVDSDAIGKTDTPPGQELITEGVDNGSTDEISLAASKTEVAYSDPQKSEERLVHIPVEEESGTLYDTPFSGFEEGAGKEELQRLEEIRVVLKKLEEMRNQPDNIWKRVAVRTHSSAHDHESDSDDAKLYICEDMPEIINGDTSQHPKMRIKAARKRKLSQKARLNLESAASPDAAKLPRPSIKARISLKTESYSIVDDSLPTNATTPPTSTKNNDAPAASRKTKLDSSPTQKISPPKKKHLRKATEASINPAYVVPFEHGWKRELVYRSFTNSESKNTRGADVYYYSPDGMKFRSSKQIANILSPDGPLSTSNFTFSKDPVLFDNESDNEVVRDANEAKPKFLQDFISNVRKTKGIIRKPKFLLNPKLGQQGNNNVSLSDGSPLSTDLKNKMSKIMFRPKAFPSIAKGTPKQKRPTGKNSIGANSSESSGEFEMGTLPPGWSPSDESFNSTASEYTLNTTNLSATSIPSARKVAALKVPLKTKLVANSAAKHSATSTPIRTISTPTRLKAVSAKATSTTANSCNLDADNSSDWQWSCSSPTKNILKITRVKLSSENNQTPASPEIKGVGNSHRTPNDDKSNVKSVAANDADIAFTKKIIIRKIKKGDFAVSEVINDPDVAPSEKMVIRKNDKSDVAVNDVLSDTVVGLTEKMVTVQNKTGDIAVNDVISDADNAFNEKIIIRKNNKGDVSINNVISDADVEFTKKVVIRKNKKGNVAVNTDNAFNEKMIIRKNKKGNVTARVVVSLNNKKSDPISSHEPHQFASSITSSNEEIKDDAVANYKNKLDGSSNDEIKDDAVENSSNEFLKDDAVENSSNEFLKDDAVENSSNDEMKDDAVANYKNKLDISLNDEMKDDAVENSSNDEMKGDAVENSSNDEMKDDAVENCSNDEMKDDAVANCLNDEMKGDAVENSSNNEMKDDAVANYINKLDISLNDKTSNVISSNDKTNDDTVKNYKNIAVVSSNDKMSDVVSSNDEKNDAISSNDRRSDVVLSDNEKNDVDLSYHDDEVNDDYDDVAIIDDRNDLSATHYTENEVKVCPSLCMFDEKDFSSADDKKDDDDIVDGKLNDGNFDISGIIKIIDDSINTDCKEKIIAMSVSTNEPEDVRSKAVTPGECASLAHKAQPENGKIKVNATGELDTSPYIASSDDRFVVNPDISQLSCSTECVLAPGLTPNLECSVCKFSFHHICCGLEDRAIIGYICQKCRIKRNEQFKLKRKKSAIFSLSNLVLANEFASEQTTSGISINSLNPPPQPTHIKDISFLPAAEGNKVMAKAQNHKRPLSHHFVHDPYDIITGTLPRSFAKTLNSRNYAHSIPANKEKATNLPIFPLTKEKNDLRRSLETISAKNYDNDAMEYGESSPTISPTSKNPTAFLRKSRRISSIFAKPLQNTDLITKELFSEVDTSNHLSKSSPPAKPIENTDDDFIKEFFSTKRYLERDTSNDLSVSKSMKSESKPTSPIVDNRKDRQRVDICGVAKKKSGKSRRYRAKKKIRKSRPLIKAPNIEIIVANTRKCALIKKLIANKPLGKSEIGKLASPFSKKITLLDSNKKIVGNSVPCDPLNILGGSEVALVKSKGKTFLVIPKLWRVSMVKNEKEGFIEKGPQLERSHSVFSSSKIIHPNTGRSAMQNHSSSLENHVDDADSEQLHSMIHSLLGVENNRRLENDTHRSHVINAINLDRTAERKEIRRQSHVVDVYMAPLTPRSRLTEISFTFGPAYSSLIHSFSYLRVDEVATASRTNKLFQMAATDTSLWNSVCLKNVKVKNWDGFRKCLTQRGTRRVDFRKTLSRIPPLNPHEPTPCNSVSGALVSIPSLRHIDFGQCDAGLFEYVVSMVPTLKVVNAQSIRSNIVSCEAIGKLRAPRDLRLRSPVGLILTSHIQNINHFNDIVVLSLTSVRNLKTDFFHVVKHFMKLESLSLGECTDIEWNEAASCLVNLSMLRKLRIEKVANNDPDYPLLKAVGDMPSITCLELINFEVKSDFDLAIAYCTNLTHLLIIPTYMTQSATTNQLVINGIKELTNLKQFVWSLTLELLKVTDLFMDQWQNQVPYAKPKQFMGDMPESIPILKSKPRPGQTGATQVDILPITKLESILERLLPQTSITIERIPFSTSWKRNIPENTLRHPTPGLP